LCLFYICWGDGGGGGGRKWRWCEGLRFFCGGCRGGGGVGGDVEVIGREEVEVVVMLVFLVEWCLW
jgi:hypothetical protein